MKKMCPAECIHSLLKKMTRILIIGAKGFIGQNVVNHFSGISAYEVWCCDVVNDYGAKNYFVIDASNSDFEEVFEFTAFDICINCSGSASVPDSLVHPLRDFFLNTVNVFKLLEAIRKHAAQCKFINISSAAVYGNPANLPIPETANLKPLSPYGQHKLQAESICEEYHHFYDIQTCCLRIFSAYGNGLKKQLFWDIAQKTQSSQSILLYGTGEESRDFIHINDIVQAIALIILNGDFNGLSYNIANEIEVTTKDAAKIFLRSLNWSGKLEFNGQQRAGDPLNWRADISKLKALGYFQKITINEGLNMYAEWLREEKLV